MIVANTPPPHILAYDSCSACYWSSRLPLNSNVDFVVSRCHLARIDSIDSKLDDASHYLGTASQTCLEKTA